MCYSFLFDPMCKYVLLSLCLWFIYLILDIVYYSVWQWEFLPALRLCEYRLSTLISCCIRRNSSNVCREARPLSSFYSFRMKMEGSGLKFLYYYSTSVLLLVKLGSYRGYDTRRATGKYAGLVLLLGQYIYWFWRKEGLSINGV